MVRVSIRTSWVVNFTLFCCYRPVIYTRPMVASVCIVVCVYMATPTGRGGGSLSWQHVPLSHLALPVNHNVQYSAVILYSAVISIIMHCTSQLTGHAMRDNGTHCQDNALPPPSQTIGLYCSLLSRYNVEHSGTYSLYLGVTGQLADTPTRRLVNSRTRQLAYWTSRGLDNSRMPLATLRA